MTGQRARHIEGRIDEALTDTRIVVIQGARQVGKTTLVRKLVSERSGRFVTLDDDATREIVAADPFGFLTAQPDQLLAIDEVQRLPQLVLALKMVVDLDPRPGRFLITGSANLVRLPRAGDSLAGRTENIELHGFSQGELAGHREQFLDRLLGGERFEGHHSRLTRHDYLQLATAGGYPEALMRAPGRRRQQWMEDYLAGIVRRDAAEVSDLQRLSELPLMLRTVAARNSAELNVASIARDTGIPTRTLAPYFELLELLYLTQRIPAWSTNLTKRVVARPKISLLDSGLASHLINVSADGAAGDHTGALLEGFVAGELRRQLAWAQERLRISHFRDQVAGEVDLVLETPDGRVAGIEVKSTSTLGRRATKGLATLRDRLGERFVGGLVLYTGQQALPAGDRIAAVPIDVIWTT